MIYCDIKVVCHPWHPLCGHNAEQHHEENNFVLKETVELKELMSWFHRIMCRRGLINMRRFTYKRQLCCAVDLIKTLYIEGAIWNVRILRILFLFFFECLHEPAPLRFSHNCYISYTHTVELESCYGRFSLQMSIWIKKKKNLYQFNRLGQCHWGTFHGKPKIVSGHRNIICVNSQRSRGPSPPS